MTGGARVACRGPHHDWRFSPTAHPFHALPEGNNLIPSPTSTLSDAEHHSRTQPLPHWAYRLVATHIPGRPVYVPFDPLVPVEFRQVIRTSMHARRTKPSIFLYVLQNSATHHFRAEPGKILHTSAEQKSGASSLVGFDLSYAKSNSTCLKRCLQVRCAEKQVFHRVRNLNTNTNFTMYCNPRQRDATIKGTRPEDSPIKNR